MQLNVKACALAGAILWGIGLLLMTWWLMAFGNSNLEIGNLISQVYVGYRVDFVGSLIGLIWGAIDGLFGGFIFASVYNLMITRVMKEEPAETMAS